VAVDVLAAEVEAVVEEVRAGLAVVDCKLPTDPISFLAALT
jgi:hypothetical protein